jgi:hypothetical protein
MRDRQLEAAEKLVDARIKTLPLMEQARVTPAVRRKLIRRQMDQVDYERMWRSICGEGDRRRALEIAGD